MTNWIVCKLDEICDIFTGNSINEKEKLEKYTNISMGYNYIGTKDVGFDQCIDYENGIKIPTNDLKFKIAPKGSVLLCIEGGSAGRKIGLTNQDVCFGNKLCAFVSKIDNRYIFYFLQTSDFRNIFSYNKNGLIGGVSVNKLKDIKIPLSPLAEQGRIVAKIEELFAGIDAGVENLKSVKNQIALYRQSILKSAFDFDASTFSALKNLIDKVRYGTSKKCSTEENVNSMPVYRIPNIDFKKGVLDKTDLKFASFDDSEKSSLMLKSGDILIIRSNGSLNLVGRAALVYNTDTNGLYAGYLMRLRIKDTEKLLPKFLLHFLNSGKARAYIEEKAKSTSGVNNINSEEISDLQIPVPTLAEQERIVAEIESRFERADALETAVDRALNDAEKLKQAVLKKAFSGELVPQNPDDEPASVLLDRIRAARASELPAKKGKRK